MKNTNCPACGAPVAFQSDISLIAVCAHCRSGLIRKDVNLETFGRVAELHPAKSRLKLGVRGEYKRVAFNIVGRVQMKYDGGYWSEWCLSLQDGRFGWLGEAMGQYSVSFPVKPKETLPTKDQIDVGAEITLLGVPFTVSNIEEAAYFSAEGELPADLPLGETSVFVDLANHTGRFATLDFSEEPPLAFMGEYVPVEELKFQGLNEPGSW